MSSRRRSAAICFVSAVFVALTTHAADMAFDSAGNLFFGDIVDNKILRFAPDGTKTTVAEKISGELAVDSSGNLLVAMSSADGTIYKIAPDGSSTVFASGVGAPASIANDAQGNVFVFDLDTGSIFKFSPDGSKSTFLQGKKPAGQMFADSLFLACDHSGNLFTADSGHDRILKFTPDGKQTIFASKVKVNNIAIDLAGDVYASNMSSGTIFKFAPNGAKTSVKTKVTAPEGLVIDQAGNLFVWDSPRQEIDKVAPNGSTTRFADNKPSPTPPEKPRTNEEREAQGDDTSIGLPDKYAKTYLVSHSTMSPNKKFALMYPTLETEEAADGNKHSPGIKDYLIGLEPFRIISALPAKFPYFEHESHGGLSAEWAADGAAALITLDGKWGPRDVFLVELHDGKLIRTTNLAAKAHDLLLPKYRSAKAARYNDHYDFIFVEDTTFKLDGGSHVLIDGTVETSPNMTSDVLRASDRAWSGHVAATWDIAQAKFTSTKVSGELRRPDK